RAVVFCIEDVQLIKGAASRRRRYLDLLLTQTDSEYLTQLQRYGHGLRSRNALIRARSADAVALESFTRELMESGSYLTHARHQLIPKLAPLARAAYERIGSNEEQLMLEYRSSVTKDFAVEL